VGTPIEIDGCIYAGTTGGIVFSLDADTGEKVWTTQLKGGGTTSLSYANGRLFANVAEANEPKITGIDASTGKVLWSTRLTKQGGAEVTGSPTAFGPYVMTGFSGASAEVNDAQRNTFRGGFVIARQSDGKIVHTEYTVPEDQYKDGATGGGIWTTPSIDTRNGYAYIGSGNPYAGLETETHNAMLKVDVDPKRSTFGQIVGHYKGTYEQYLTSVPGRPWCEAQPGLAQCFLLDVDFGASVNLFKLDGRLVAGDIQKSGVYHLIDAKTMESIWTATLSGPIFAGNAATAATDGEAIYVSATGGLYSLDAKTGATNWVIPAIAGSGYGPTTVANGVVYQGDGGFLRAIDAETGDVLLYRPLAQDSADASSNQDGGVIVARQTVYVNGGTILAAYRAPE
jgi:polyvinyl alcohol dehydrogenase (cytochrome)